MATGTVKWFSDVKGFGFIIPDDGSQELFVHFRAIQMEGFRTLAQGQRVNYEIAKDVKGRDQAAKVAPLGNKPTATEQTTHPSSGGWGRPRR